MSRTTTKTNSETIEAQKSPRDEGKDSGPASNNARDRVRDDGTLAVFSKKSERLRKKRQLRRGKTSDRQLITLLDLPFDVTIQLLSYLRPTDVFRLSRTCRSLHAFLLDEHPARIARSIVQWRYPCLEKCMRLPVLVSDIDGAYRDALQYQAPHHPESHQKQSCPFYQHIKAPEPTVVCTCMTCGLRWNILCIVVDFAHWQDSLDKNEPLPVIPRGRQPEWNTRLLDTHAGVVKKAISPSTCGRSSALWHAVIMEAHLDSMVRSIRRHSANKFNKRPRFRMTAHDAASGTDEFLQRRGPPSLDFPFQRDNYYMLEAYLPNRSWFSEEGRWGYMPAEQHDKDLEQLRRYVSHMRGLLQCNTAIASALSP